MVDYCGIEREMNLIEDIIFRVAQHLTLTLLIPEGGTLREQVLEQDILNSRC